MPFTVTDASWPTASALTEPAGNRPMATIWRSAGATTNIGLPAATTSPTRASTTTTTPSIGLGTGTGVAAGTPMAPSACPAATRSPTATPTVATWPVVGAPTVNTPSGGRITAALCVVTTRSATAV